MSNQHVCMGPEWFSMVQRDCGSNLGIYSNGGLGGGGYQFHLTSKENVVRPSHRLHNPFNAHIQH